jgi:transmembrane sensor
VTVVLWTRYPRSASAWFARRRREGTAGAEGRFQRWLATDPRNESRYEQQELIWKAAGELEQDPEIQTLLAGVPTAPPNASPRAPRGRGLALAALACALTLLVIGLSIRYSHRADGEQVYATRIGEERRIVLPDRSRMTLNTATRVRVSYGKSHRTVILEQGEATFSVVHDPARVFEVTAAGGTTRDLGTQFNVLAAGDRITVTVLEGRVAVTPARTENETTPVDAPLIIAGGEQVTYAGEHLDRPEPANIARIQGWHAGRIVLRNVELGEAIAEFNRYSALPLRLGNPALATQRITGVFRTGETDAFLNALQEAFHLHIERTTTAIVLQ